MEVIEWMGRRALAHVPASAGTPLPVVVLLHGSGGSGAWALRETRWPDQADAAGILLLAPDATRPDPSQPARFYTNPAVWNDGSGFPPADRVAQVDDVGFIAALLDELPKRWQIDPHRIYVTGFSNGAGMTFRLGRELSHRIAAIAPVAGHLPPGDAKPARPVPTLYLTGLLDPLIPPAGGIVDTPWMQGASKPAVRQTLERWAEALGLPRTPAEVLDGPVRRERWADGLLEAWLIDGLGHHWPGGRGELNHRIAGPPSDRVNATAVVWEFFEPRRA